MRLKYWFCAAICCTIDMPCGMPICDCSNDELPPHIACAICPLMVAGAVVGTDGESRTIWSKVSAIVDAGSGSIFSALCPQATNRSVLTSCRFSLSTCGRTCTVCPPIVISRRSFFTPSSPVTCVGTMYASTTSRAASVSMLTTAQPISLCFFTSQRAPLASSGCFAGAPAPRAGAPTSASASWARYGSGPSSAAPPLPFLPKSLPLPFPPEAPSLPLPFPAAPPPLEWLSPLPPFPLAFPPLPPFAAVAPLTSRAPPMVR
mmetsp:Transcript_3029/g.9180  ORF Transcript_3029/g.9180 Transcript_3029/m.9180 type:complete len:261 (-) Transcript_3029:72-854(-)